VHTDAFPAGAPHVQQLQDWFVSMTRAEERAGTVDDIAGVALFLASEKSRWITGQWISVSGGITGM
jgi:NAD(P)-dependent dehydrogenase (short-subunit alcohol dehydrogenase family)